MDHDGLLELLTTAVGPAGQVSVSACLLACERSNVVVVAPSAAGRRAGGRPVWLAEVLRADVVDAVALWVRGGGPGLAAAPKRLAGHRTTSPALAAGVLDETQVR